MKFEKSVKKVFTSKYFLYFLLFLSIVNLLGYLMMKNFNAIAVFLIIGVLMYYFSKNMAVILLVCLVVTNLLMSRSFFKEGMENGSESTTASSTDPSSTANGANGATATTATTATAIKDKVKNAVSNIKDKVADKKATNSSGVITGPQEEEDPASASEIATLTSAEAASTPQGADAFTSVNGARPDYASTITNAYKGLNDLLDPDAIRSLTQETMTLMQEQQKLYKSMEAMSPLLGQAKGLLEGMDINNLKGLGGLIEKFSAAKV